MSGNTEITSLPTVSGTIALPMLLPIVAVDSNGKPLQAYGIAISDLIEMAVGSGIPLTQKGAADGVSPLDSSTFVPIANINSRAIAEALNEIYVGTITAPVMNAYQVFALDTFTGGLFGKGTGTVKCTVSLTIPCNYFEYQLIDASTNAVLQDWTEATPPLAAGTQEIAISGVPASQHWYLMKFRANRDNSSAVETAAPIGVGLVIGIAGQSLAVALLSTYITHDPATIASLGISVASNGMVLAAYANSSGQNPPAPDGPDVNYPPSAYVTPADATVINGAGVAELLRLLTALAGVPCAIVGYAVGGTGILSWLPGYAGANAGHWTKLTSIIDQAGGKLNAFIWDQGHYDAKYGMAGTDYQANLALFFSSLIAAYPGSLAMKQIVSTIPALGSTAYPASSVEVIRNAALAYVAATPNAAYVDGLDVTLWTDLIHPSQAGGLPFGRHFYRAIAGALGLLPHADRGPLITGASRAYGGTAIIMPVTQTNGGTAFVGVGAYADQFVVYPAGTTSGALSIASVDISNPAQIMINLSSAPSEPAALDVWYRLPQDTATIISHGVYDNVLDSDGLTLGRQLAMIAAPINSAAPQNILTVGNVSNGTANTSFGIAGTYSVFAPGSLQYSIDQGATWIAASATIGSGNYSFTISGGLPVGTYSIIVKDPSSGSTATTNVFSMTTTASTTALPALSSGLSPAFRIDAANIVGHFFTDAAMTQQAIDGSYIGGINDKAGSGQSVVSDAPTYPNPQYLTNAKNGMPGLRFTGSLNSALKMAFGSPLLSAMQNSANYCVLIVFTPLSLPSAGQIASDPLEFGVFGQPAKDYTAFGQIRSNGSVYLQRTTDVTTPSNCVVSAGLSGGTLCKSVQRYDGTNLYNAVNAVSEVTLGAAVGTTTTTYTYMTLGVSIRSGGVNSLFPLDGWIHEIVIWESASGSPVVANSTDRDNLLAYAATKWGS